MKMFARRVRAVGQIPILLSNLKFASVWQTRWLELTTANLWILSVETLLMLWSLKGGNSSSSFTEARSAVIALSELLGASDSLRRSSDVRPSLSDDAISPTTGGMD